MRSSNTYNSDWDENKELAHSLQEDEDSVTDSSFLLSEKELDFVRVEVTKSEFKLSKSEQIYSYIVLSLLVLVQISS